MIGDREDMSSLIPVPGPELCIFNFDSRNDTVGRIPGANSITEFSCALYLGFHRFVVKYISTWGVDDPTWAC